MGQEDRQGINKEETNGVLTVTLDDPSTRNALGLHVLNGLVECMGLASKSDSVRVVVLKGAGGYFSSGGNIKSMADPSYWVLDGKALERPQIVALYGKAVWAVKSCAKPVIAQIEGGMAGAGISVALACDFRIMADTAKTICAFTKVGLMADSGFLALAREICGAAVALDLSLTGRVVSAAEAKQLGLVNIIVPQEELAEKVREYVDYLMLGAPLTHRANKEFMNKLFQPTFDACMEYEVEEIPKLQDTADHLEGVLAFREKRKAVFTGK